MTATLMFERVNNHSCSFPLAETQPTHRKDNYKFYQLELRQLLTESRFHQEQDARYLKPKPSKAQLNNQHHHHHKRLPREQMERTREKPKLQARSCENDKRSSSVLSIINRGTKEPVTFTITSTNILPTVSTESRSKLAMRTKPSSLSNKPQPVVNALSTTQKSLPPKPPMKLPSIEIDGHDKNFSQSTNYSYTEVLSSSQNQSDDNDQYARRSIMNNIMSHLHTYTPSDVSKWSLYRDFHDKISASISPTVYRDFERIIL